LKSHNLLLPLHRITNTTSTKLINVFVIQQEKVEIIKK